ncbi:MAG TPA: hemerythrin domain-containing protein [Casimicrobiaceae bacterium]|nr:hemerythrin domain-containing protein [Casimicrobiaceae bacterium]
MQTKTSKDSSPRTAAKTGTDAVALLTADHARVKKLFAQYEKIKNTAGEDEKETLAIEICDELTVHASAEEEIFYPAVREAIDETDLVDEADVEHASAKDLIAQIRESGPDEEHYDAKVKVLAEYINHHVQEEEGEMFPKAKKAKMNLEALGAQIEARKEELMAEIAGEDADEAAPQARGRTTR